MFLKSSPKLGNDPVNVGFRRHSQNLDHKPLDAGFCVGGHAGTVPNKRERGRYSKARRELTLGSWALSNWVRPNWVRPNRIPSGLGRNPPENARASLTPQPPPRGPG